MQSARDDLEVLFSVHLSLKSSPERDLVSGKAVHEGPPQNNPLFCSFSLDVEKPSRRP